MDPCWWPVFIWSSCSKLFIFMFCFPSRDFSVYILFAWYSKWALYQCLAWFFVSVLQAVFSFFPKRILISYITQIQSLTLHINPVIYPWFPFDYLMNQHPTIPAFWFIGESKHIFFLTLQKNSEAWLPLISTDNKLVVWDIVLKLPFLPHLGLDSLCPRLTLNLEIRLHFFLPIFLSVWQAGS